MYSGFRLKKKGAESIDYSLEDAERRSPSTLASNNFIDCCLSRMFDFHAAVITIVRYRSRQRYKRAASLFLLTIARIRENTFIHTYNMVFNVNKIILFGILAFAGSALAVRVMLCRKHTSLISVQDATRNSRSSS